MYYNQDMCGSVKTKILILIVLLLSIPLFSENILILNSYHRGKILSDDIISAIVETVKRQKPNAVFYIEDMDTKRHAPALLEELLISIYSAKYKEIKIDLIFTVDNNALNFMLQNRSRLFPEIPIVFSGVNNYSDELIEGIENISGVAEAIDIEKTISLAFSLHPQLTHFAVVADLTPTGQALLKESRKYTKDIKGGIELIELYDTSAEDLVKTLKNLPKTSAVLRLSFFTDSTGKIFNIFDQIKLLTSSGLPVYDCWDEGIGLGYIGGYVVTGQSQGEKAAEIGLRILNGEDSGNIPVLSESPNVPVLDKIQLDNHKAEIRNLPVNVVLRNQELPFFKKYARYLAIIALAFLLLILTVLFLIIIIFQRRKMTLALMESQENLRITLDSIGDAVIATDMDEIIIRINRVAEKLTGWSRSMAIGKPLNDVCSLINTHSRTFCPNPVETVITDGIIVNRDQPLSLISKDGSEYQIFSSASPIRNDDRENYGIGEEDYPHY